MKTSFEHLLSLPGFTSGASRDVKINILYRKLMFLHINQLLKDEDVVRRFKRPMSLETFRTAHGFNVFLARAVRSSLNKFFVNLCRAGVLASPIPFDSHAEIAKDTSYDTSFCPLGKYPYSFSPKIFENLHSSGFGGLLPREKNELFRNLLTFNDSPEERLAEERAMGSLLAGAEVDGTRAAIRFRDRKQLGTRVTNAIDKTPLFYSPLILFSLKKDRNVPRYTLTFAVRDRYYFRGLCDDWTLDYNTAPSPFVSYSFDREMRSGVAGLYWLTVTVDYGYLLPTATNVLRSRIRSGLPPYNFSDFLKFFVKIQNFFTDVFVRIYGKRYFNASSPSVGAIIRKFTKHGRGGLEAYLNLMEPFFTLSRFGNFPLLKRDRSLAEINEGGSLFPLIENLVHTEKCFLISLEGKNHFGLEALFDNKAPEPEEEPPSLTIHGLGAALPKPRFEDQPLRPDVAETSDIMPEVLAALLSGPSVISDNNIENEGCSEEARTLAPGDFLNSDRFEAAYEQLDPEDTTLIRSSQAVDLALPSGYGDGVRRWGRLHESGTPPPEGLTISVAPELDPVRDVPDPTYLPAQDPRLWPRSAHPQITGESGVDHVADLAPVTAWDPGTMEDPVHHQRRVQRALGLGPSPESDNSFGTMAQAALDQLEEGSSTSNISISDIQRASITDNRLNIESIADTDHRRRIDREHEERIELDRSLDVLFGSPSPIPPFEIPHGASSTPSYLYPIEGVDPIPEVLADEIRGDLASMEEPGETSEIQVNPEIQSLSPQSLSPQCLSPFIGDQGPVIGPLRGQLEAEALARIHYQYQIDAEYEEEEVTSDGE